METPSSVAQKIAALLNARTPTGAPAVPPAMVRTLHAAMLMQVVARKGEGALLPEEKRLLAAEAAAAGISSKTSAAEAAAALQKHLSRQALDKTVEQQLKELFIQARVAGNQAQVDESAKAFARFVAESQAPLNTHKGKTPRVAITDGGMAGRLLEDAFKPNR